MTFKHQIPSPEGLEKALRNLGKQPSEVIYIGDSSADYEMAKAAGVYFIGVSSEFNRLWEGETVEQV